MKNPVTVKNVLILLLILVILYLAMCNKQDIPKPPNIKTTKEQANTVRIDSIASAHYKDSVNKIISYWQREAGHWEGNWNREVKDNAALQDTLGSWLSSSVPDTCEAYKQRALLEYNKLVVSNKAKDTACSKTIGALKNVITQTDVIVSKQKEDYTKLKVNFDTALSQQTRLQDYADKLTPHNKIAIGLVGNLYPVIGYGIGADFIHKKGIVISLSAMTMNGQLYGQLGIKKVISLRRK